MENLPVISSEEWGEINVSSSNLPELPPFPMDAMPEPLRSMALEIEKAVKVPVSLADRKSVV